MVTIQKLLVATDFSEGSQRALDYAAHLAGRLDAALLLVHAHATPTIVAADGLVYPGVIDDAPVREALQAALGQAADRARGLGAPAVEAMFVEGQPWAELVRIAGERKIDVIVMGTHGRSGLPRFLLGSVADKVIRKAPCPVLTVGPKAA